VVWLTADHILLDSTATDSDSADLTWRVVMLAAKHVFAHPTRAETMLRHGVVKPVLDALLTN
jgi:hypothetical protein